MLILICLSIWCTNFVYDVNDDTACAEVIFVSVKPKSVLMLINMIKGFLVFKLSPCVKCNMFSFGYFPGV
jgi:hypothetical protein